MQQAEGPNCRLRDLSATWRDGDRKLGDPVIACSALEESAASARGVYVFSGGVLRDARSAHRDSGLARRRRPRARQPPPAARQRRRWPQPQQPRRRRRRRRPRRQPPRLLLVLVRRARGGRRPSATEPRRRRRRRLRRRVVGAGPLLEALRRGRLAPVARRRPRRQVVLVLVRLVLLVLVRHGAGRRLAGPLQVHARRRLRRLRVRRPNVHPGRPPVRREAPVPGRLGRAGLRLRVHHLGRRRRVPLLRRLLRRGRAALRRRVELRGRLG